MYTPSSYPCFIFYFDGSQFRVETPEDLANMWPGYANNPCASFPEMAQGWRWKISHDEDMHGGPYAPDKTKYRYERGIPLEALVYTEKQPVVGGVQRNTYEVWRGGSPEVERGIREGVFYVVPLGALLATSAKNGRCFLGDEARDAYDKRYDVRDLTGFERDVPSPPDTAPPRALPQPMYISPDRQRVARFVALNNYTGRFERQPLTRFGHGATAPEREPVGVPQSEPTSEAASMPAPGDAPHQGSPQNRLRKKVKKYSNRDYFVKELGEVINVLRLSRPGRDPTLEEIAHASDKTTGVSLWTEGMSRSTLKARLSKEEHNINLDTFLAELPSPCRRLT